MTTPRTTTYIWIGVFVLDVAAAFLFLASIIIDANKDRPQSWYNIALLVLMTIGALGAAYNAHRWWRIHQTSQRGASLLPTSNSQPPMMPIR
ncbi:hypothetical protein C8R46DRAFT_1095715 [Mycena filopes]|nr:hypothetical protein C8R46DRAFT_1095715 [Mycena filopes]